MRNTDKSFSMIFKKILIALLFCLPVAAMAAEEPQERSLRGNAITSNATVTTADPVFNQAPGAPLWSSQTAFGVQNFIQFEIDFKNTGNVYFHNLTFSATCNVDINCYGNPASPNTITQTYSGISLDVNYNSATGAAYKGIAAYKFNGAYKVTVKVNSITATGLSSVEQYPVFMLTNKLVVNRQYNFNDNTTDILRYKTDGQKLDILWTPTNYEGAESFDLEWTYIDAMSLEGGIIAAAPAAGLSPAQLDKYFRNNSSRVNLSGNQYQFNLNYNKGYILFRIRGVQYRNSDGLRLEGNWNYNATALGGSLYSYYQQGIVQVDWHEHDLNWQYNVSYAEDGKKKEVITYFDGSLRSRQTVTINNEDKKSIIAEPVYDAEGRSAMSILPAPVNDDKLKYYRSFNLSSRIGTPPVSYKDIPVASCGIVASSLSATSGVEQYYSANNPFITDPAKPWNKAIPQSEGFPFAVTLYTPDNTGRVRAQGGVGKAFQLGTGHETKYFYGKPSQYELDRLFGAEAGDHTHYLKNMVQDANGQVSVSYQNSEGKTIATALAGLPSANTEALATSNPPLTTVHDVLLTPSSFQINSARSSLEASATFLVSSTGNYKFTYRFTPEQYNESFSGGTLCYTCSYDLLVTLKDGCDNELKRVDIKKITPFNTNCVTPAEISDLFNIDITKIGEYTAYFELVVNKETLDAYTDDYLVRNTDIKKLNYFLLQQLVEENLAECYNDCEACKALPATEAEFTAQIKAYYTAENLPFGAPEIQYAQSLYATVKGNCISFQSQCTVSPCTEILDVLKQDVTPGGQYAEFDNNYALKDPEINVLSHYRELTYHDEAGQPATVEDDDGNLVAPALLPLKQFIQKFEDSWAESLVPLHPEYCYYTWCTMNEASRLFDQRVENMNDPVEAQAQGFYNRTNFAALLQADPFFAAGGLGHSYYTDMGNDLEVYSSRVLNINDQSHKNILKVIDYLLYCGNSNVQPVAWNDCNKSPDDPCRSAYKEWLLYKQWYADRKLKYYTMAMRERLPQCKNCFIPSSGNGDPGGWTGCIAPAASNFTISVVPNSTADGLKRIIIKYRNGDEVTQWPLTIQILMTSTVTGVSLDQPIVFAPGFGTQEVTVQEDFDVFTITGVTCSEITDGGRQSAFAGKKQRSAAISRTVNAKPVAGTLKATAARGQETESGTGINPADWQCPPSGDFIVTNITPSSGNKEIKVCYTGPAIPAGTKVYLPVAYSLGGACISNSIHNFEAEFCSSSSNCYSYSVPGSSACEIDGVEIKSARCEEGTCEWECPTNPSNYIVTAIPASNSDFTEVKVCYIGPAIPPGKKVSAFLYINTQCGQYDGSLFSFCSTSAPCVTQLIQNHQSCSITGGVVSSVSCTEGACDWECPADLSNYTVAATPVPNSELTEIKVCYTGPAIPPGKSVNVHVYVNYRCGPEGGHGLSGQYDGGYVTFCSNSGNCLSRVEENPTGCTIIGGSVFSVSCTDDPCSSWECPTGRDYDVNYQRSADGGWDVTTCYWGSAIPLGKKVKVSILVTTRCGEQIPYTINFCSGTSLCNTRHITFTNGCIGISGATVTDVACTDEPCDDWECPADNTNYTLNYEQTGDDGWDVTACYTGPAIPAGKKVNVSVIVTTGCRAQIPYTISFCSGSSLCNTRHFTGTEVCDRIRNVKISGVQCTNESCGPVSATCPDAEQFTAQAISRGTCANISGYRTIHIQVTHTGGPLVVNAPVQRVKVKVEITKLDIPTLKEVTDYRYVWFAAGETVKDFCYYAPILQVFRSAQITETECTGACPSGDCCDDVRYSLYQGKVRRFQDYAEPGDLNAILEAYNNGGTNFEAYPLMKCKSECEAMADGWIQDLKNCTTDLVKLERVRRKLIDVCRQSCMAQQGNVNPTNPLPIYPYSDVNPAPSFESVIIEEFGSLTPACAYDLTSDPYPWGKAPILNKTYATETNTKICATLHHYIDEAHLHGYSDDVNGLHNYLTEYYKPYYDLEKEELADLLTGCEQCNNIMPLPVELPAFMDGDAKPCLDCAKYAALVQKFHVKYPGANPADVKYEILFRNFANHETGFSHAYANYYDFGQKCELNAGDFRTKGHLCETPAQLEVNVNTISQCMDEKFYNALSSATVIYNAYIEEVKRIFRNNYTAKCLAAVPKLESDAKLYEYHYTLYYYDQSSNLVKTIPPKGVAYLTDAQITALQNDRTQPIVPAHTFATTYQYNSFNQVVQQNTPDAGTSAFWYDRLGRLAVSQNAEQKSPVSGGAANRYSYTKYEPVLGRITEVGEKSGAADIAGINTKDDAALQSWLVSGSDAQITQTLYDKANTAIVTNTAITGEQQNYTSRKRVVAAVFKKQRYPSESRYDAATHYSYDITGNAKTVWQENTRLKEADAATQGLKRMDYEFDLISGKVNKVYYQKGKGDQFIHKYEYDAENRLISVSTGRDGLLWQNDAVYRYYLHGPLARTELGSLNVQGVDYAYTLQGWLKYTNSPVINEKADIGRDGDKAVQGNVFVSSTRDAYGYGISYFNGDYKPVQPGNPLTLSENVPGTITGKDLFNGNIRATTLQLAMLGAPKTYSYSYDQLNRIVKMRKHETAYTPASGSTAAAFNIANPTDEYKEDVAYDANGNILSYVRNGAAAQPAMDALTYNYTPGKNRLDYVQDGVLATNYGEDIDNQNPGNYTYDNIGNLTKDNGEKIGTIEWTVYGKIKKITKADAEGTVIEYEYDAAGNRIYKKVTKGTTAVATFYVRDAQGNTMALYSQTGAEPVKWNEQHLYGSSRLGIADLNIPVPAVVAVPVPGTVLEDGFEYGKKFFELTNHLGNVLVTVSDKKVGMPDYTPQQPVPPVDYFTPDVVTATDYYPFGMAMPGRKYPAGPGSGGDPHGGGLTMTGGSINGYNSGTVNIPQADNNFTVELWVNPTSPHEIDPETLSYPYGIYGQKFVIDPVWGSGDGSVAGMGISVGTNGVSVYEHAAGYMPALLVWQGAVTGWTHIAVVYENRTPKLYINGVLVRTGIQSAYPHIHPGNLVGSGIYGTMTGEVDEVRVWSIIRSQSQIAADMGHSIAAPQPGLAAYWPVSPGGSGTVLQDISGNGYNVVLNYPYSTANFTGTGAPVGGGNDGYYAYRYGFNGKENDNSTGEGNLDFGSRIFDTRLGRWLGVDKYTDKYPNVSPYSFCINSPLQFKDANGNWLVDKNGNIIFTLGHTTYEITGNQVYKAQIYYFYTNDGQAVEAVKYMSVSSIDNVEWADEAKTNVKDFNDMNKVDEIPDLGDYKTTNCHGNSLNLRPGKFDYYVAGLDAEGCDNVAKIYKNKAEFTPVKAEDVQAGDIAIFDDGKGNIQHSATVSKVGKSGKVKLTSKDDRKKVEHNQTIEGIKKGNPLYKNFAGYYRKNPNKSIDIEVKEEGFSGYAGYDDGEEIKKIIEKIKKE